MARGLLLTAGLAVAAGAALAHSGVKNHAVMMRMMAMSTIGDSTKVLGQMAKGERPFDAAEARAAAAQIAHHAAMIPAHFEAQEDDPKSEAKPVIWERFDDFTTLAGDLETVALEAAQTLETEADLRPALGRIGAACKACHEVYRE